MIYFLKMAIGVIFENSLLNETNFTPDLLRIDFIMKKMFFIESFVFYAEKNTYFEGLFQLMFENKLSSENNLLRASIF